MISQEAVQKFKELWKKKGGEDISDEFAADEFRNLLVLMNHIYRPVKKEWLDEFPETNPNQKI